MMSVVTQSPGVRAGEVCDPFDWEVLVMMSGRTVVLAAGPSIARKHHVSFLDARFRHSRRTGQTIRMREGNRTQRQGLLGNTHLTFLLQFHQPLKPVGSKEVLGPPLNFSHGGLGGSNDGRLEEDVHRGERGNSP
jgi:hypothetical protein